MKEFGSFVSLFVLGVVAGWAPLVAGVKSLRQEDWMMTILCLSVPVIVTLLVSLQSSNEKRDNNLAALLFGVLVSVLYTCWLIYNGTPPFNWSA